METILGGIIVLYAATLCLLYCGLYPIDKTPPTLNTSIAKFGWYLVQ